MKPQYIGNIKPKVGDQIYNTYTKEILTILEIHEYYGYVFEERGCIQGEFMYPHWTKLKELK